MSDKRISQFTEKTTFGGNDYLVTDNASEATSKKVKASLISDQLSDMQNVYGAKNLVVYPYDISTKTENGVTFTDNGDGTITVDGAATADTYFAMRTRNTATGLSLAAGTYTLSGCPADGGMSKYQLYIINTDNTETIARDVGAGYEFTLANDVEKYGLLIRVSSGQTVSNLVFKPMIRLASIKDDSWVPYARTNKELTELTNPIPDMINVLGAKNLIPYPYPKLSGTVRGITWSDNGDGGIIGNGTGTEESLQPYCELNGNQAANVKNLLLKRNTWYTISSKRTSPYAVGTNVYFLDPNTLQQTSVTFKYRLNGGEIKTRSSASQYQYMNGIVYDEVSFCLPQDMYAQVQVRYKAGTDVTVTDDVQYPMLRLASIEDDTWEPYAKTNQELTKDANAIEPIINILGAKNLLKCTNSSYTINGLTFTLNSNGSIKVIGTATATTYYRIDDVQASSGYYLESGRKYILSGCPAGGSEAGYRLYIESNGLALDKSVDYGDGATFTAPTFNNRWSTIIRVMSGTVFGSSGKTFYPMIRPLGIEDDTFVPYAETNAQLTADVASINDALSTVETEIDALTETSFSYQDSLALNVDYTVPRDGYLVLNANASTSAAITAYISDRDMTSSVPAIVAYQYAQGTRNSVFLKRGMHVKVFSASTGTSAQFIPFTAS